MKDDTKNLPTHFDHDLCDDDACEANGSLFFAVAFSLVCWLVGLGIWKAVELISSVFPS